VGRFLDMFSFRIAMLVGTGIRKKRTPCLPRYRFPVAVFSLLMLAVLAYRPAIADVTVQTGSTDVPSSFQMGTIPPPAINDIASVSSWAVARGVPDRNSGSLQLLYDGLVPRSDDSPRENFFFAPGTSNGCIAVDLGQLTEISEVVTYSWHSGSRGPHVYNLYASTGAQKDFRWNQVDNDADLVQCGWSRIASVDTRNSGHLGGQHASVVSDPSGAIGTFRYLLFEMQPTEIDTPFGNTFFSEIDIVARSQKQLQRIEAPETQSIRFSSIDGRYQYTIDTTAAPELAKWSELELKPIILEWYPRIVSMLPSDGFQPIEKVQFRYLPDAKMSGIPAYAQGGTISMNAEWMQREKNREAKGAIVHEMVHVVQSYQGRRQRNTRRTQTPGWIVEGIPDYIRWFVYEPQSGGAKLSKGARANAKHDASYRVSANFIDWVLRTYDSDGTLLSKLNAAAREGRYSTAIWQELTGKTEDELARSWKDE
jgi:hypothetical protein